MEWAQDLMQWLCFCKEFRRTEDDDGETAILTSNTTTVTRIPREQSVESHTSHTSIKVLYSSNLYKYQKVKTLHICHHIGWWDFKEFCN